MNDLAERLTERLARPLPGHWVRSPFAPELSFGRHRGPPRFDAREAAVMVLLYFDGHEWQVPLTLRPDHLPDHAGQICLPGGMTDLGESAEQTALRELDEELGVAPELVRVLGTLSPIYIFGSNFWVTPVLGVTPHLPQLSPNAAEVADVVVLSLAALLDPHSLSDEQHDRRGVRFRAAHIRCGAHRIWGATSMMLGELIALLHEIQNDEPLSTSD